MSPRGDLRTSLLTRGVAVFATVLVLALAVLAASPELHERLHGHELHPAAAAQNAAGHRNAAQVPDDEDGCIVSLFAQGVVLALAVVALVQSGRPSSLAGYAHRDRIAPESPRYLRLPTQAPPVGLN